MVVEFYDPVTKQDISYYIEPRLLSNLDKVKDRLEKKDKDFVMLVDGKEGSGKSTLAVQMAKYVDNSFCVDRCCMTATQFKEAIYKAKKGQAVIYDEAFTGLSSKGALSEINRMLVSLMMQMRQKNLMVIIVLPTFYMLEKYVAIFRGRVLVHIWEREDRRYFGVFNNSKQKILFAVGKKYLSYRGVRTRFSGRFYGKFPINDPEYRKKKSLALEESEDGAKDKEREGQVYNERDFFISYLHYAKKVSVKDIKTISGLKSDKIYRALKKFKEKSITNIEKTMKKVEKGDKKSILETHIAI
ncbi:MAG: hypothetical protein CMC55_04160 [Flavobacteriaceae bacterium]|nr:hypothetical protein [Flavobacteriaceae bacterium]